LPLTLSGAKGNNGELQAQGRAPKTEKHLMPATFDWDEPEEIGIQLADKFPNTDPLSVRFTDLHKWVTELDGFSGDPTLSNEGKLEAIQMAWLEEHNERKA
jgi:FeS assembly protein IscX